MFDSDNPHKSVIIATPATGEPIERELFYSALDDICDKAVNENKDVLFAFGTTPFDGHAFHGFILLQDTFNAWLAEDNLTEAEALDNGSVVKRDFNDDDGASGAVYLVPLGAAEWAEFSNLAGEEEVVNGGLITAFPTGFILNTYDPRLRSDAQKIDIVQVALGLIAAEDLLEEVDV